MKAATSETICTLYITATRQYFKVNFLMLIFQPKLIDLLYLKSMYWSVSSSIFVVCFVYYECFVLFLSALEGETQTSHTGTLGF